MVTARDILDDIKEGRPIATWERQLHSARYAYHKQVQHKYRVMQVLPIDQAREMYRLA